MTALLSSCDQTKNPIGLYRATGTSLVYEVDFQAGGTGRQTFHDKQGPFQWRIEGDDVLVTATEESGGGGSFRWDGNDLILLGPNLRFQHPANP